MNLVPEKFKLIPTSYKGDDFMKIQYDDNDLTRKIKGQFHIFGTKSFGFGLLFTTDDYSIVEKIHELAGFKVNQKTIIFLFPLTKKLHFSIKKTSSWIKTNAGVNQMISNR